MTIQEKIIILLAGVVMQVAMCAGVYWVAYHRGDTAATQRAALAIGKLKTDAAATLVDETEKTRAAEAALQAFINAQNLKDQDHETTVNVLADRLRTLAGPAGRLRDPHASAGCGRGSGSTQSATATATGDRAADTTETGGLLSKELSGLLQRLTREADDINTAYASCRADAYKVRAPH